MDLYFKILLHIYINSYEACIMEHISDHLYIMDSSRPFKDFTQKGPSM